MKTILINKEECKGGGRCVAVCPKKLIELSTRLNAVNLPFATVTKGDRCIGCGACFYTCPEPGAITITKELP